MTQAKVKRANKRSLSEKYEAKIDEYTEETAKTFTEMLADARDVLSKEAVSQTTIDSAYVALQQAIFELRLIPNKDKLEDLIKEAEKMDLSGYTSESVKVFEDALAQAKVVMKDPEADQDAVDAAEGQLRAAVEQLEKADKPVVPSEVDKSALEKYYNECVSYYKEADYTADSWKV